MTTPDNRRDQGSSLVADELVGLAERLGSIASQLVEPGRADPNGAHRYALMTMSQAYLIHLCADPSWPDWVPFLSTAIPSAATNPDAIYSVARIDGRGTYRLSGFRGTVVFADILVQRGIIGVVDEPGPVLGVLDLMDLPFGEDGSFEVILSPERPDRAATWSRLDPSADHLWLRQVAYDWETEVDFRVAIERVDAAAEPRPPAAEQLRAVGDFVEAYVAMWQRHVDGMRARGLVNRLELQSLLDASGEAHHGYYQGLFDVPEGQALVLDVAVPERCRYWGVQLTDESYVSIDWTRHQSSLNAMQATIDGDGRFRAVICSRDPGVANWLDTGGRQRGTIFGRWNHSSDQPLPALTLVAMERLVESLPPDTATVTPSEREAARRRRARGSQLRKRW